MVLCTEDAPWERFLDWGNREHASRHNHPFDALSQIAEGKPRATDGDVRNEPWEPANLCQNGRCRHYGTFQKIDKTLIFMAQAFVQKAFLLIRQ